MSHPIAGMEGCSGGCVAHTLLRYTLGTSQIKDNNLTTSFIRRFFSCISGNLLRMLARTLTDVASPSVRNLASAVVDDLRYDFMIVFPKVKSHCFLFPP